MKIALRLFIAGLIVASIVLGVLYYINMPDANLSTYNLLVEYDNSDNKAQLNQEIPILTANYSSQYYSMNYTTIVKRALDINYNYYKNFLLYVNNIDADRQEQINNEINDYFDFSSQTLRLAENFNNYYSQNPTALGIPGAYLNFINAYNAQVEDYCNLVALLKEYVIDYAFDGNEPTSLNHTLIDVQLEFAKAIVEYNTTALTNEGSAQLIQDNIDNAQEEINSGQTTVEQVKLEILEEDAGLTTELDSIIIKYIDFDNDPESDNLIIQTFIESYKNLENKTEFFTNFGTVSNNVYNFLNRSDYNIFS